MTTFILLAALMTSAALALIAWPLYRARASEGRSAIVVLALLAIALPVASVLLYRSFSNWDWNAKTREAAAEAAGGAPHSLQEMVSTLEEKLKKQPDDVQGWLMLGRSRYVMNDFPGAVTAFAEAYRASKGESLEAVVGYGETLAITDQNSIRGKAGELFEAALKMDGANPKALWYGGIAAATAGHLEVARERWATLVKQPLPDDVRAMVAERIGLLDKELGRPADAEIAKLAAAAPAGAAAAPTPAAAAPAAVGPGTVTVHVKLAAALSAKVPAGMPLFVLARDPSQPGPPFAAKRFASAQLPMDVTLTEQDAMMPARTLKNAHELVIVARFSSSGRPTASSGDLYGEVPYSLAKGAAVDLVIDKQVP